MKQLNLMQSRPLAVAAQTLANHDDDLDVIFGRIRQAAERKRTRLPARLAARLQTLLGRFIPFRNN